MLARGPSVFALENLHVDTKSNDVVQKIRDSASLFPKKRGLHTDGRWSSTNEYSYRSELVKFKSTAAAAAVGENDKAATEEQEPIFRRRSGVRNVAIIAHVDHGKTTLVDQLLKASSDGSGKHTEDRLLDCGELERERGITITSKVTRCDYRDTVVNIVDSPGHADFSGEVNRILSLVDGVCLVVDAAEGPMAQTKYVLSQALSLGLRPMVILNKVDRPDGWNRIESGETESELLDLFDALGASDKQMDYLTLYASARDGWVTDDIEVAESIAQSGKDSINGTVGMESLLDRILETIPEPRVQCFRYNQGDGDDVAVPGEAFSNDIFSLAAVTVGYDPFLGRTCTGRINSGSISLGDNLTFVRRDDDDVEREDGIAHHGSSTLGGIFVNRYAEG